MIALLLRLRGLIASLGRFIRRDPKLALCLLLVAYALWEHHRASGWAEYAHRLKVSLAQVEAVSTAELARATAARDAAIQREKDANNATDHRVEQARATDRADLAAYVERLRAAWGAHNSSPLPATSGSDVVQGGDRSSADPELFQTLTDDLGICSENTRRLLEIHNQAVSDTAPAGQPSCSQGSGPSSSFNSGNC